MEKALIIWLEDNAQKQIPVDGNNIKQQALRFYKMIKDEQPSTSIQSTHEKSYVFSASTAHAVGGEGFDDLVFDDIDELMIDKVLSEEEILHFASQNADSIESSDSEEPVKLTANLIQEGLQLANKLGHHFITNDPNVERAAQFQRELNSCMAR